MPFSLWSRRFCCPLRHFPALCLHVPIFLHFQPQNFPIFLHFQMPKFQLSRLSNRSSVSPLPASAPSLRTLRHHRFPPGVCSFRPTGVFRRLPFYLHGRCERESHRPRPFRSTFLPKRRRPVHPRSAHPAQGSPPSAAFHWTHPGSFPDACNL